MKFLPFILSAVICMGLSGLSVGNCADKPVRSCTINITTSLPIFYENQKEAAKVRVVFQNDDFDAFEDAKVNYRIYDFNENLVADETITPETPYEGIASADIKPPIHETGWYKVVLRLTDKNAEYKPVNRALPKGDADYFTYAVIPAVDKGYRPNSFFGVCEHHLTEENVKAMVKAGVRWLRIDVSWGGIQSDPDSWDWSRMDEIVRLARKYCIELLPIIDYSTNFAGDVPNKSYWEQFVYKVVSRYKDKVKYWEVWNEANIGFWKGTREQFAQTLSQAYKQIKKADPTAKVLFAGTSGCDTDWIHTLYKNDGWNNSDIAAVHPYMQPNPPERALTSVIAGERSMETEFGEPKDLWITEMGYHTSGGNAVDERVQAKYLTRSMVMAAGAGVKKFILYEFADGGVNPDDSESNFGLLYSNLYPKPSYVAYAVLERIMGDRAQVSPIKQADKRLRIYSIKDSGSGCHIAAWALKGEVPITIEADSVTVIDMMGRTTRVDGSDGKVILNVGESPVYIANIDETSLVVEKPKEESQMTGIGDNILTQGDFEKGTKTPSGWQWSTNMGARAKMAFATGTAEPGLEAKNGSKYITLTNKSSKAPNVFGHIHTDLKVKPFTSYKVSIWVRTKGATGAWFGGGPGWTVRFPLPVDTDGKWVLLERTIDTWDEFVYPFMVLVEDVCDKVDIDDIKITELQ